MKEESYQEKMNLNPNCSEIVFSLGKISKEEALKVLRQVGIVEVAIPDFVFGKLSEDSTLHVLADKDNPFVPNFDDEYRWKQMNIFELETGETKIMGGINLEWSAFPTMKKIDDAFPNGSWEEMSGGGTTIEYDKWLKNGMEYTPRQKELMWEYLEEPGENTKTMRKEIVDPVFEKLNQDH